MRRMEMLQEILKMRFEEVYSEWSESRLSQEETAQILAQSSDNLIKPGKNRHSEENYPNASSTSLRARSVTEINFIIRQIRSTLEPTPHCLGIASA
jgi:hypothetical protein